MGRRRRRKISLSNFPFIESSVFQEKQAMTNNEVENFILRRKKNFHTLARLVKAFVMISGFSSLGETGGFPGEFSTDFH